MAFLHLYVREVRSRVRDSDPFVFTTDEYGSGSWHLNLRDSNFLRPGTYRLSVWINEAGLTILISDNFDVVVEQLTFPLLFVEDLFDLRY